MTELNGQETKQCPRCGTTVLARRPICRNHHRHTGCGFRFPMSCEGCGREVTGRVFCPECIEPGVYHWSRVETDALQDSQKVEPTQPLRLAEKSEEIFPNDQLIGPTEHEFAC